MTLMDRLSSLLSRKASKAGAAVAAIGLAPARWTPRRYDRLADEGYRKNVVAYRCVREVARACASVPWLLYKGARELDTHPLLDRLSSALTSWLAPMFSQDLRLAHDLDEVPALSRAAASNGSRSRPRIS